ncbi:octopamine receptor Oamb-like [Schistocerca cancellata]|uniref:octopamine receptor Oamb-like n=1 Tax=Schistocerca cancellata TaxID=274614 RepID=UPI002117471F|nr:octopamine receptor Oamb-like [Schistocerca cancellata]
MDSVSGAAESGNGSLETQWCPEEPEIAWTEGRNVATLGVLAIIDVMVVAGNCLVVAAVFLSHKLRSVTNLFIVSLAVADLLVGVAVLPFSAAWEVFKWGHCPLSPHCPAPPPPPPPPPPTQRRYKPS